METPCGARGQCRKCLVRVLGEAPAPTPADLEQLTRAELAQGFRLSCQLRVGRDLEVAVVPAGALDPRKARLGALAGPAEVDPWAPLQPHRAGRWASPWTSAPPAWPAPSWTCARARSWRCTPP